MGASAPAGAGPTPGIPGVEFGTASSLAKLRPRDPVPRDRSIELSAARGECEAAQVAVRASAGIAALSATADPLAGPSRIDPMLYRVDTVALAAASGPDGEPGEWPDPLVPTRDPFFGEPRRAFPVAVAANRLQAVWVELCVPAGARAGTYRGAVVMRDGPAVIASIPLRLTVWPFALPATGTFTVTFGLPTRTGTRALGKADDPELARALAAAALRHRISPHGLSYDPPYGRCTAASCALDFRDYDREMAPILDGTLVPGVRGTFADVRISGKDWQGSDADLVALLRAWRRHFDEHGWSGSLWLYTLDEPKPSDVAELARRARAARAAGVRVFVTSTPIPALRGLVDAWAPNVFFFEDRPGHGLLDVQPARGEASAGKPFWYASCMSHGCDELPPAGRARTEMVRTFRGWPGYEIDRPGAAARVMGWLAYRERVAGELYYDMLQAWGRDAWKDVRAFAGNGDGTLLYPGLPARFGGQHPFPVESIRLKLVRDAAEDRELLALAERHGLGALAQRLARTIAPSMRGFARDPSAYLSAHRALGDAIAAALQR